MPESDSEAGQSGAGDGEGDREPGVTTREGGAVARNVASTFLKGIHELLDLSVVEATPERVVLSLPVTSKVHQPYGILHGGVSALLAESAASFGAALNAGGRPVVGIELNASHLRAVRDGTLTASATPLRVGRSVQMWEIVLTNDERGEICRARCTLAVRDHVPRDASQGGDAATG